MQAQAVTTYVVLTAPSLVESVWPAQRGKLDVVQSVRFVQTDMSLRQTVAIASDVLPGKQAQAGSVKAVLLQNSLTKPAMLASIARLVESQQTASSALAVRTSGIQRTE